MRTFVKGAAIALLAAAFFFIGAYDYRVKGWPFSVLLADSSEEKRAAWIRKLRDGGYILYFRHAHREKWPEDLAFDIDEFLAGVKDASEISFRRAVCLSDQGIEEAKMMGRILQLSRVPAGDVFSSPSCRARQTALHAFGKINRIEDALLFPDRPGHSSDELLAFLRSAEIRPKTNTIIVGHGSTLERYRQGAIEGDVYSPQETGFWIIERGKDGKLAVAFRFKSIKEFAITALGYHI